MSSIYGYHGCTINISTYFLWYSSNPTISTKDRKDSFKEQLSLNKGFSMDITYTKKTIIIFLVMAGVLFAGFICGHYYGATTSRKEYLYIDIEKVMSGLVEHYKDKPLSRKNIEQTLALKQKELAILLQDLEEKYIVFAAPKVIAGAKNITNDVIQKLSSEQEATE
jgi:hypothetical protein